MRTHYAAFGCVFMVPTTTRNLRLATVVLSECLRDGIQCVSVSSGQLDVGVSLAFGTICEIKVEDITDVTKNTEVMGWMQSTTSQPAGNTARVTVCGWIPVGLNRD